MVEQFSPRTFQIVIEGIAKNLFVSALPCVHRDRFGQSDGDDDHQRCHRTAQGGLPERNRGCTRRRRASRDFVYMRWSGTPRMGDAITVTVWQLGATSYGDPEPMPEVGFDPENPTGMFKQGRVGAHPVR